MKLRSTLVRLCKVMFNTHVDQESRDAKTNLLKYLKGHCWVVAKWANKYTCKQTSFTKDVSITYLLFDLYNH